MVQKILLQFEIDDSQLDQAQAKVDKLISSLERAEALMTKLDNHDAKDTPTAENTELRDAEQSFKRLCHALLNLHYA